MTTTRESERAVLSTTSVYVSFPYDDDVTSDLNILDVMYAVSLMYKSLFNLLSCHAPKINYRHKKQTTSSCCCPGQSFIPCVLDLVQCCDCHE